MNKCSFLLTKQLATPHKDWDTKQKKFKVKSFGDTSNNHGHLKFKIMAKAIKKKSVKEASQTFLNIIGKSVKGNQKASTKKAAKRDS